jgi:hypothetical protein
VPAPARTPGSLRRRPPAAPTPGPNASRPRRRSRRPTVRANARDEAARAAAEDDTWTALHSDIDGAYAHLAASAAAHDAGEIEKSGREIEAYQAADDRVRADCAEADEELGPLQP